MFPYGAEGSIGVVNDSNILQVIKSDTNKHASAFVNDYGKSETKVDF